MQAVNLQKAAGKEDGNLSNCFQFRNLASKETFQISMCFYELQNNCWCFQIYQHSSIYMIGIFLLVLEFANKTLPTIQVSPARRDGDDGDPSTFPAWLLTGFPWITPVVKPWFGMKARPRSKGHNPLGSKSLWDLDSLDCRFYDFGCVLYNTKMWSPMLLGGLIRCDMNWLRHFSKVEYSRLICEGMQRKESVYNPKRFVVWVYLLYLSIYINGKWCEIMVNLPASSSLHAV